MKTLPVVENCDGCGSCCLKQESPPGFMMIHKHGREGAYIDADYDRFIAMPPDTRKEYDEYAETRARKKPHPNNGVCIWFDEETRECKHYDIRPDICRNILLVGDASCRRWRNYYPPNET